MFKSENIVVTNGATHCKLKQSNKTVFQFKYLIKYTKVSCKFMGNKELHLLSSRRRILQISLYLYFIPF